MKKLYEMHPNDSRVKLLTKVCQTATSRWGTGGGNVPIIEDQMAVRRLTAVEAHRLQGFPDDHCDIPWRNKDYSPDSQQFKAMGNSMAVPVMAWIGKRIQEVDDG